MGTENKECRGLAEGWKMAMLALVVMTSCNSNPIPNSVGGRTPERENPEIWGEVIYDTDSTMCSCTYGRTYEYLLTHTKEFKQCKSLMILNQIVDCNDFQSLIEMEHLERLNVSELGCPEIPAAVTQARHLRYLTIDFPLGVDTVPSILFRVPNVEGLGIYGKTLAYFERDIPIAPKLGDLDFGTSPIKRLPMVFGKFPELSIITAGTPDRLVENYKAFRKAYPDMAFSINEPD